MDEMDFNEQELSGSNEKNEIADSLSETPITEAAGTQADAAPEEKTKKKREPLFHIVKRTELSVKNGILVRAGAVLAAMAICAMIILILAKQNPISVFGMFVKGSFGNKLRVWSTMHDIAILLAIALAITPAFKMRFWNTGAEGQVLIGCLATGVGMIMFGGKLPEPILLVVLLLMSVLAGVIWGVIPAVFKAFFGTNETLFTLMMNYVAIQLIEFFLKVADKSGSNTVDERLLKHGFFPSLFGQTYLINILIVVALIVIVYVYLKYSKHGYEISVVGESENTARYVGINVKKVIIRTMAISGGLCGLVGLMLVSGSAHSVNSNLAGGRGFTAIMVSWLAKFNPLYMILTSFLIVFMSRGASEVATQLNVNESFSEILTAIILFFIIGCEFFIQYRVVLNHHKTTEEVEA